MPSEIPIGGRPDEGGGNEVGEGGDGPSHRKPPVDPGDLSHEVTAEEREAIEAHYSQLRRVAATRLGLSAEDVESLEERFGGSLDELIEWKRSEGQPLPPALESLLERESLKAPDAPSSDVSGETERTKRGWNAVDRDEHGEPPAPDTIRLTDDRRDHIVLGEGRDRGGHAHGVGNAGKTEFPVGWSSELIAQRIVDVALNPDRVIARQRNGRWKVQGDRDGVVVIVVVNHDGRIWTAWPEPGGRGVVQNPSEV